MTKEKDILTPSQIEPNLPKDYSTPSAHCNLSVLQEAEETNSILKNQENDTDAEYLAMLDEKNKMQKEGKLAYKKEPSERPFEWQVVEKFLIDREYKFDEKSNRYVDRRGHIRKTKEKAYPVDVYLLQKICAMHPIVGNVHKLVSICRFSKNVYQRVTVANTSCRKVLTKEKMVKIANILELEDWRVLINKQELDSMSKTEKKIKKIKEDMESYRSKIEDLQKELRKQNKE